MSDSNLILAGGLLLAIAIAASLVARRLRVPGLVLFLGIGMILGAHGLDFIDFANPKLGRTIGVVALALILFEGGLAAGWKEIRPVFGTGLALATVGTAVTAVVTGLGAVWLLDLSTLEGLLLGSIVASTDGAAVFALLRGSSLRRRLARTLEAEAGLNDPVAVLLVLGFIAWIQQPNYTIADFLQLFVSQLAIGAVVGLAVGRVAASGMGRVGFASSGLYPVASIATAAVAFGLGDVLGGSGFLAVYLAGLVLGSAPIPAKRMISDFHDGLAWVSQIALFLALGLLVDPGAFGSIWDDALIITAILMFVARPIAVALSTLFSRFSMRENVLLGWAGMRGAVPIVLATFPVIEGVPGADGFFNLVFFVVVASTLVQGTTFEPLARALGLTTSLPAVQRPLMQVGNIRRLGAEVIEYPVGVDDAVVGHVVNELELPREALVNVIVRGDEALLPRGSTEIAAGDRLHILLRESARARVEALFETWRTGPVGLTFEPYARPIPGRPPIFSVRPWQDDQDGDPGDPQVVSQLAVRRRLRIRRDQPGALVVLDDGRFAVTGEGLVAVGGAQQLFGYCSKRIRGAEDRTSRAWWQEVAGALAHASVG